MTVSLSHGDRLLFAASGPVSSSPVPLDSLRWGLAIAIFVVVYLILSGVTFRGWKIDRAGAAVVGAVAIVATGVLSFDAAWPAVKEPAVFERDVQDLCSLHQFTASERTVRR